MTVLKPDARDEQLRHILELVGTLRPVTQELQPAQPTQVPAWPWQVPQVPSYTADHTPNSVSPR
jgi:hypothetical protein